MAKRFVAYGVAQEAEAVEYKIVESRDGSHHLQRKVPWETRSVGTIGVHAEDGNKSRTIGGIAVPYNQWSEDLGFLERFAPGSLTDTLRDADIRVIYNHNADYVVGRKSAGTARFVDTDGGLAYEADAPNASWADGMLESIRRGDIRENSFGFMTVDDSWEERDGKLYRTVLKAELREVGPQTFPAYPQSTVDVRSIIERGRAMARKGRYPEVERLRLELDGLLP